MLNECDDEFVRVSEILKKLKSDENDRKVITACCDEIGAIILTAWWAMKNTPENLVSSHFSNIKYL